MNAIQMREEPGIRVSSSGQPERRHEMRANTIPIRCANGRTIYMNAEKSPVEISCKNIIAGLMIGTTLLALAVIAYACM